MDINKPIGLNASDENSCFIWSSCFAKTFDKMPDVADKKCITVVINSARPTIFILEVDSLSNIAIKQLVERLCKNITSGCNYTYSLVKIIGTTYFCN